MGNQLGSLGYCKKMRSEFQKSEINSMERWNKCAKSIYDKFHTEYETDLFNLETETNFGEDRSGLIGWKFKAQNNLKELPEFSSDNL